MIKKLMSVLLAALMTVSVLSAFPILSFAAVNGTIQTVAIHSESELDTKIANGYTGLNTDVIGKDNLTTQYLFTMPQDGYAFINVVSKLKNMNASGTSSCYIALYSENLATTYIRSSYCSGSNYVSTKNNLQYLAKGNYILEVKKNSSVDTNLTMNIGVLPSDTAFLSVQYIQTIGESVVLQIDALDKVEQLIMENTNYGKVSGIKNVGDSYQLDANNQVSIPIKHDTNAYYPYVTIWTKDVYGVEHETYYGILCDLTARISGIENKSYTGSAIAQTNYSIKCYNDVPNYTLSYANNTNIGTAYMTFTGMGNWIGSVTKTFNITPVNASKCSIKLSSASYTYDGKVKKPGVTVKNGNKTLKNGTDYTVSYASGRKNVGQYTVTIKFKGAYTGTVKKTFTIKPKGTSVSKVTAGKKKFTVKWKKQATQTTGYQIQYSTDKNFKKNNKTVTVSKNKTTSKTVSKLSGKKKYYVRVRTYKTVKVNGKNTKIYSSWSKAKTVTTKK